MRPARLDDYHGGMDAPVAPGSALAVETEWSVHRRLPLGQCCDMDRYGG
jgi:hypothetical protein